MTYLSAIQYRDSANLDAFSRLRVSQTYAIFDSKQLFDNQPLFWDDQQTSGSGTSSTYSTYTASSTMAVTASTAGVRVRQTFRRFNYQPGKSQLVLMTGVLGSGSTGITRRIGVFDSNNGLFFQLSASTLSVVVRTSTSGSPVDTVISSNAWNIDPMDGTGPSKITLDTTKTQIFIIDYQWLGVGRVRYGFDIDGIIYYCHAVLNANNLTVPYISTPNLPIRYEIANDGTGGTASLVHICSAVISEGGQEDTGFILSANSGTNSIVCAASGTYYAILGLRLKSSSIGATIKLLSTCIYSQALGNDCGWYIFLNPTVSGSFTYSDLTNSALQTAVGSATNIVTNGTLLTTGFNAAETSNIINALSNGLTLGSSIAGVVDTIVLCAAPLSGNSNIPVYGALTWREQV